MAGASDIAFFESKASLLSERGPEVSPFGFYRSVFPVGSFERLGHQEDGRGNGVAVSITTDAAGVNHGKLTLLTDGLEQLPELLSQPFVVLSPLSYFGRSRAASNALWMHALAIDVDYVDPRGLRALFSQIDAELSPKPTYIANSGHGIHLYFVFERPLPMYPPAQKALKDLKTALMPRFWNKYTSTEPDKMEALGVVQGFRMVGSRTKMGEGRVVTAYRIGERVTVDYLNGFVPAAARAEQMAYHSETTLEEARERWPEWYERRIVRGEKPGRWYVKRDLYDWFKRQMDEHAQVGHRYFCMMCLAIYAAKCGIEYDELLADAKIYQERMDALGPEDPFMWEEALKALEAYNEDSVKYPRDTISRISGVPMVANRRKGQKQVDHLEEARMIRDLRQKRKGSSWWEGSPHSGRPKKSGTKKEQVRAYATTHPEATQREIARALGCSPTTVNKWLK